MDHIAIDLGGRNSQICVRQADGTIVREARCPTRQLGPWLQRQPPSRVVLETCAEAFRMADLALEYGHEVRVVPASLVRALGVGARRTKTDRRDAQVLSEVSCRIDLPSVHLPAAVSRQRKTLSGMREALVEARTKLVNTVRGWLRALAAQPRRGVVATFPQRVRHWASVHGVELPGYVERQLVTITMLTEQVQAADRELTAEARRDPVCRRLMTVPGVGPVTAIRYVAALDVVERFADAHQVEAYLGLAPGERSSGDKTRRTGITKAGPAAVRRALVQAAWAARRAHGVHPMVSWSLQVEARRGRRVAITGLARKLAGILYALWRDGTTYRSTGTSPPSGAATPGQAG